VCPRPCASHTTILPSHSVGDQPGAKKLFGSEDFIRGNFARRGGVWCEIKSVTIDAMLGAPGRRIYRLTDTHYG
jgi:hypothetical protein